MKTSSCKKVRILQCCVIGLEKRDTEIKNAVPGARVRDPGVCIKHGELKVLRKVWGPSGKPVVPFVFAKI